jgi:hypothetical protein
MVLLEGSDDELMMNCRWCVDVDWACDSSLFVVVVAIDIAVEKMIWRRWWWYWHFAVEADDDTTDVTDDVVVWMSWCPVAATNELF